MGWLMDIGGSFIKFFAAIVIPITLWFFMLRVDATANAQRIAEVEQRVAAIDSKMNSGNDRLAEELKAIQRSLGRIEGALKVRSGNND